MEPERRTLRVGAAVIACAIVLRLLSGGAGEKAKAWLERSAPFLLYLETGRRIPRVQAATMPTEEPSLPTETTAPTVPPKDTGAHPVFTREDLSTIDIRYDGAYRPDLAALLEVPLVWNLKNGSATVLILHTHTSESYTKAPGEAYTEESDFRTLDEGYNMLSIGDAVAEILTQAGVQVIHDRTFHDYPSYNGSYADAREGMESYLAQYPTVDLVLDLHRDAADDGAGGQMATHATVEGKDSAQLMLVVGTDEGGLEHPDWEENLSLGLKLTAQLERMYPGLCRPVSLRTERFNQDLSPGCLLIEVGAAGNSHEEALTAAKALAQGILALAEGANLPDDGT